MTDHQRTSQSPPPAEPGLARFLQAIHGPDAAGVIELRLIEDKKRGDLVDRRWLGSPEELLAVLPDLLATADARSAAIFYGVLRRREHGAGTSDDCLAGAVVWNDLDFKDFKGGEAEARERL